ncbi:TPA: CRISPR-associated ring nuclease Csm6 [Photobacterium damselae]
MAIEQKTLITVLGSSPAVITETLYGLGQYYLEDDSNLFPSKMIVFTTTHGEKIYRESEIENYIKQLCDDYNLPKDIINKDDEGKYKNISINVVKGSDGELLDDIHNEKAQKAMANELTHNIRELTKNSSIAIHASIAGGRKSMSFYMGYIFSMFARPCDALSHVLVSPVAYEFSDFKYPTKKEYLIKNNRGETILDEEGNAYDARNAIVELSEIPFIRLNNSLTNGQNVLVEGSELSYSETIDAYQLSLNLKDVSLVLDNKNKNIIVNGHQLSLSMMHYALYKIYIDGVKNNSLKYQRNEIKKLSSEFFLNLRLSDNDKNYKDVFDRYSSLVEDFRDQLSHISGCDNEDVMRENIKKFDIKESTKKALLRSNGEIDTILTDRLVREINEEIRKYCVGDAYEILSASVVSKDKNSLDAKLNNEYQYRKKTKLGWLGLCINPNQITIIN